MTRFVAVIGAAIAAGCAVPAETLKRDGVSSVHELKQPHTAAAACLANNIDMQLGVLPATIRHAEGGASEISARVGADHAPVLVEVTPSGQNSRATIWTSPRLFLDRDRFIVNLTSGC